MARFPPSLGDLKRKQKAWMSLQLRAGCVWGSPAVGCVGVCVCVLGNTCDFTFSQNKACVRKARGLRFTHKKEECNEIKTKEREREKKNWFLLPPFISEVRCEVWREAQRAPQTV